MGFSIPLFDLDYGEAEQAAARRVLDSKWLTMGEETAAFEREFAAFLGAGRAVAVANCTAGLHLAYEALGVRGGEVIMPSLTFVATANAAIAAGARPVFADIKSLEDPTIDPEAIQAAIGPKTRAIAVMHYGGHACDMEAIQSVAGRYGLPIVEDCAHTPGATLGEAHLGTFGAAACFSFFSNKNLSTGEGGMVCTADAGLAERLRRMRSHGMTSQTLDRHKGHAFSYDVVEAGHNFRMDELRAALGRAQLEKLEEGNRRRREIAEVYRQRLGKAEGLILPFADPRGILNFHIFPVLLPAGTDRAKLMAALAAAGIQTSIHYPPIHLFAHYREAFGGTAGQLPRTEAFAARALTLPMHPLLTDGQAETVAGELLRALGR
jgi:dTDP-4-amino-4,6-dideoxygalactose transaminase